jgi:ADP-dependent NAD(P)H-hydrate dehydratase / NAD(P)H-hydrate epimerase
MTAASPHSPHSPTFLYTEAQIRAAEKTYRPGKGATLMQRAGEAVAKQAMAMLKSQKNKSVLILAGPGNNGGDAWVAARALQLKKIKVTVVALGDHKLVEATAKKAHDAYVKNRGALHIGNVSNSPIGAEFQGDLGPETYGLIVDGLFGIGFSASKRGLTGEFLAAAKAANYARAERNVPILAIDVASGLDAETGVAVADAICATTTLTFIGAKPGLYTADGTDCSGNVIVESLGFSLEAANGTLLTREIAAAFVPQRSNNSHKGSYGNVAIVGGAAGMVGAAVLAARAALHMGPGKVYLGLAAGNTNSNNTNNNKANNALTVDAINPEIMVRTADVLINDKSMTVFAIGMGLGESKAAAALLIAALKRGCPMLLDADALNLIARNTAIGAEFGAMSSKVVASKRKQNSTQIVLTPHPGEAARLLNTTTEKVQANRIVAAQKLAKQFNAVVVLKGAGTVISQPDGTYVINTNGNPGMASGGMGDALSGMIAAFMAQGLTAWNAAQLGVFLHGASADAAIHHGMGPLGLTASEVIFEARTMLNSRLEDHHDHDD